jgi:hypothetical protein
MGDDSKDDEKDADHDATADGTGTILAGAEWRCN